jgi:hypothetical protein
MTVDRPAEAAKLLRPYVAQVLDQIPEGEFTTRQYMLAFRELPEAAAAYEQAIGLWGEDRRLGLLSVHGHVGPRLLRESGLATWLGYIGNYTIEDDGLHVPVRWRKAT